MVLGGKGSFRNHIWRSYGLTTQQYYNLVVFGNKDFIPTCPTCGTAVGFIKLTKGYHQYCSHWCMSASEKVKKQ